MKKIGFVGLGNMGSKMVINLLKANYEVIGYDINESFVNSLVPNGLKKASSLVRSVLFFLQRLIISSAFRDILSSLRNRVSFDKLDNSSFSQTNLFLTLSIAIILILKL